MRRLTVSRHGGGKSLVASALWAESSSSVRRPPRLVKRVFGAGHQEARSGSDWTSCGFDRTAGDRRFGGGKSLVASALWAESSSSVRRPPRLVKRVFGAGHQEARSGSDWTSCGFDRTAGDRRFGGDKSLVASALWAESSSSVRRPPRLVKRVFGAGHQEARSGSDWTDSGSDWYSITGSANRAAR
jgi:hypothetical protein